MKINAIIEEPGDLQWCSGSVYYHKGNNKFYFCVHTGKFSGLIDLSNGSIWSSEEDDWNVENPEKVFIDVTNKVALGLSG